MASLGAYFPVPSRRYPAAVASVAFSCSQRQRQADRVSSIDGLDDPIVPQTRRSVVGSGLLLDFVLERTVLRWVPARSRLLHTAPERGMDDSL